MTTVADLIRRSLTILGVVAAGESVKAEDQEDAFNVLNDMLDSWAGERPVLFATLRSTYTLTPSLAPHTIGVGGTFNTTRPVRIDRASITPAGASGTEYPLRLLSDAEWQATQGKTNTGMPLALWVETSHPLMKLNLWPIPSAADTLVLYTWLQLGRFAATSTTVDLPPGYARAIRYNLAKELAPEFGVALSAEALSIADESKSTLKRMNHQSSYLQSDIGAAGSGGGSDMGTSSSVTTVVGLF